MGLHGVTESLGLALFGLCFSHYMDVADLSLPNVAVKVHEDGIACQGVHTLAGGIDVAGPVGGRCCVELWYAS